MLKLQKLELNDLNHVKCNHTLSLTMLLSLCRSVCKMLCPVLSH